MTNLNRKTFIGASRLAAGALLVAVLGAVTLSAWAQGGPGMHGGMGGPGMGGPGMGMMAGRGLDRMLDSVNATADQRTQIKKIADAARTDLMAQHQAAQGLRQQGMQLFTQPTVDANAAEQLRLQMLQQHDAASKRMLQAMLDISRVLTPEQRKQMADKMSQRRAMFERHMHERQQLEGKPAAKP
jgi:Spy/CpxP family protein refolding chaperone